MKIVWNNKIGIVPKTTRENQVWDDDMNEIKTAINTNDDESIKASGGTASFCEINGAMISKLGGSDKTLIEIGDKCIYKMFDVGGGNFEVLIGATYTNLLATGNVETIGNWEFPDTVTT